VQRISIATAESCDQPAASAIEGESGLMARLSFSVKIDEHGV
jgi:hypothetical protein